MGIVFREEILYLYFQKKLFIRQKENQTPEFLERLTHINLSSF